MGMEIFEEIGREVEERWAAADRDTAAFCPIAHDVLSRAEVEARTSLEEILIWTTTAEVLPRQVNAGFNFGDPPVTVFEGVGFYIEALLWRDGMPSVHQHGFAGAFRVLAGGSCQTTYTFEERERPSPWVRFGRLVFRSAELLTVGDCRPIVPGTPFIHGLFHLERPSLTIVVRTPGLEEYAPQFDYYHAGLGIAALHDPVVMRRRLEALECMADLELSSLETVAGQMLASADLHGAFHIVKTVYERRGSASAHRLVRGARERYGEHIDLVLNAVELDGSRGNGHGRRRLVEGEEHRFFLGLLTVVPTRADMLRLIGERYPGLDPVDRVVGWLRELAALPTPDPKTYGPNVLGMELDEVALTLCEGWMRGEPEEAIIVRILEDPNLGPPSEEHVQRLAMLLPNTDLLGQFLKG